MSFLGSILKRGEKTATDNETPTTAKNESSTVSVNTGKQADSPVAPITVPAKAALASKTKATKRGIGPSVVNAFVNITTGEMMTELPTSASLSKGTDEPEKPTEPRVDVIIVGAGLAGLSAAYALRNANKAISLLVLEASDRVGGRIVTRDLTSNTGQDFWDLGAQWISGSQIHMMQLIDELDLQMYTQSESGAHLAQFEDGRKVLFKPQFYPLSFLTKLDYITFISKVEKLRLQVPLDSPDACPMATEWDSMTLAQFRKQHLWTTAAQQYFDAQIRLLFGVPPHDISTMFFLFILNSAGGWRSLFDGMGAETAKEFRIKGGTQRVCQILADKIDRSFLKLSDPVVSVDQSKDDKPITVQTLSGKRYQSERVIVALPPKFAAKLHFRPPMPRERDNLLQRMPSRNALHFVVTYKEAFWQKQGFSGYVIRMTSSTTNLCTEGKTADSAIQQPFNALYDATTMDQSPALSGVVETTKWREMPEKERKEAIIKGIEVFFGVEAANYLDYTELDWGTVPYSSSFPTCVLAPGTITGYFSTLRTPFHRVHWAGTEATTRWFGFMDGAVYSGKRAAQEVLGELSPDN